MRKINIEFFLHTTHSIERESLTEFIANDEKYRFGILHLLKNDRNKEIVIYCIICSIKFRVCL